MGLVLWKVCTLFWAVVGEGLREIIAQIAGGGW